MKKCASNTCLSNSENTLNGVVSSGGSWWCPNHATRYLRKSQDTGKLHHLNYLTRILLYEKEGVPGREVFFRYSKNLKGLTKCKTCHLHTYDKRLLKKSICSFCITRIKEQAYVIHNSCTRVVDTLRTKKPAADGLLLGVEWEISSSTSQKLTKVVIDALGTDFAIAKYDGSVAGIEVNTVPASLHTQKRRIKKACKAIEDSGVNAGIINAGIHVHFNRSFLNTTQLNNFISFFNRDNRKNKKFVVDLAGRNSTWAYFIVAPIGNETWLDRSTWEGKCSIVNTLHHSSIEIRAFQSTLNFFKFAYRLEFVAALARHCKQDVIPTLESFKTYVMSNRSTYPYLANYLGKLNESIPN